MLAQWGGVNYVMPGREATLLVAAVGERPAREVKAHRGAAPRQSPARPRGGARHDRRDPGRARRSVAGVDASRAHDLGLLCLCDPVQSRRGVPVLGLASALAVGASGARRHLSGDAGRRVCRASHVCAEGSGRPDRRPLAADRARAARPGDPVLAGRARQHGDRLRLSRRNLGAKHAVRRFCGQRRGARDPYRAPAGSVAARLSAHPLGHLGLPDRSSRLFARPSSPSKPRRSTSCSARVSRPRKSRAASSS